MTMGVPITGSNEGLRERIIEFRADNDLPRYFGFVNIDDMLQIDDPNTQIESISNFVESSFIPSTSNIALGVKFSGCRHCHGIFAHNTDNASNQLLEQINMIEEHLRALREDVNVYCGKTERMYRRLKQHNDYRKQLDKDIAPMSVDQFIDSLKMKAWETIAGQDNDKSRQHIAKYAKALDRFEDCKEKMDSGDVAIIERHHNIVQITVEPPYPDLFLQSDFYACVQKQSLVMLYLAVIYKPNQYAHLMYPRIGFDGKVINVAASFVEAGLIKSRVGLYIRGGIGKTMPNKSFIEMMFPNRITRLSELNDNLQCICCGLGLKNIEEHDEIVEEHFRWSDRENIYCHLAEQNQVSLRVANKYNQGSLNLKKLDVPSFRRYSYR